MCKVIFRTFIVPNPTDLMAEIAQMPVLNFDDAAMAQVGEMDSMDAILRLSRRHGRGVIFHVEELGEASLRFHWSGRSSALALLSTPSGIQTLYLSLSGCNPDEEEVARYVHGVALGSSAQWKSYPAIGLSAIIEYKIAGRPAFTFLSSLLHTKFVEICRDTFQERQSRRGRLRL